MVAVIKSTSSIKNALHYNENKMKAEVAQLIHSSGFGKDTEKLNFLDKLKTLEKYVSLNQRTKLNSVHISLNFDPSEKLAQDKLKAIAETYMNRIGFSSQPYLVYEHRDAGHPHIHIVTTNIRFDGTRISMQNIGKNQSEKARREIEQEYNLVKADGHHLGKSYQLKPVNIQKVQYGKADTRRAIINILDAILPVYKYASLPELNAVLRLYNVVADNGKDNSRLHKNGGLLYRVLNDKGEPVGIPIKASLIYNKPTMRFLHEKFAQNQVNRHQHKLHSKNAIDLFFLRNPAPSLDKLSAALEKDRIRMVVRQNDKGVIYGVTYVDHQTKCVFNGSELGKAYSANQIQARCNMNKEVKDQLTQTPQQVPEFTDQPKKEIAIVGFTSAVQKVIQDIGSEEHQGAPTTQLTEEERRKKRKKIRH